MAPIKRPRNAVGPPGSLRGTDTTPGPRKRLRVSSALAGSDDSASDTSDDASVSRSAGPNSINDNDEEEEQQLEEAFQREPARQGENTPMEYGIIERVDCYNFMCHEHFCVDLGPLINFIVGKNGSGKSAILTAITLCLGGKASVTNRGQSLKNFIKEGKESSTIMVRIKNQGVNAYLPDEFGNSITVERHFTRSGTSGFRIKSSSGRLVSTKKADLDSITDYFALQIDNPMNVLSQDMARQFIGNSSPSEKYKFFVKGVQLEQLDQDYRLMEESINHIDSKLADHQVEMKALESKRDKTRARLALSDRQEGLRSRIRNLRAQMVWAQVEDQERIRDACSEEIARIEENIVNLEGEVENIDRAFQEADREYETANRAAQDAKEACHAQAESRNTAKEQYDEVVKERHELVAQQRSIAEHLKTAEVQIRETQQKIEEENQRLANLDGGSNARKIAELEEMEASAAQAKSVFQDHRRERERLRNNVSKAENDLQSMGAPISGKQGELHQAQTRLRTLTNNRGKQQSGFSDRMPMLLRAIQHEESFSRPPIGPLGNYIRLSKPQWSSVLENTFGGTLSSFVVTSKRDMNILSDIMQRLECVSPIFIGNDSGELNTSSHEPDAQFDTALRILEIDDELVRRQLVINHGVEQMLLIEDLETASKTLFDGERLANVKRCFCIDKQDRRRGHHLAYTRTGEPTSSPVPAYTGQPRMKTDIEIQIRLQQDVVNQLDGELQELMQKRREAELHLENSKQALVDHGHRERDLQLESQKADDSVQELREEIDRGSLNDGQLLALKAHLEEVEEEKKVNQASYEDSVNAKDTLTEKMRIMKRELAAKDAEVSSAEGNVRSLEEEVSEASAKRRKALGDKNIAIARVEEAKRDKNTSEKKRDEVSERIQEWSGKASQVSARVSVDAGETSATLEKKFIKLKRDLDRYESEMGASREEIASAAAEANEKYETSRRQVTEFEETSRLFKDTLNNRRDRWRKFQAFITARAKQQFKYLLLERGYRGDILTNHTEKLLDLQVEPDITKDRSSGRGAKTLSGGEKSFSQICLLLALWEAMGSPIRCLDEFDVYMDYINRTMTIDMLMTAARRSVGRQFILITPGSRNDIRVAPDVRVKELAEPERGQQILPYTS